MSRFMIPKYELKTFVQVWDNAEDFLNDFKANPMYNTILGNIQEENVILTYYLLYNRYGNNPILNMDDNQFKFKLFGRIIQFGPAWEQRVKIQNKLRSLGIDSDSEIFKGSRAIYNHAFNPETEPSTGDLDELYYINEQNTTNYKKSVLEGLALLADSLRTDVTEDYINKFRKLFSPFVYPERPVFYVSEDEDNGEEW